VSKRKKKKEERGETLPVATCIRCHHTELILSSTDIVLHLRRRRRRVSKTKEGLEEVEIN
jgi:hypothetical protein